MRDVYMVCVNIGGSVFVKTLDYFRAQKGFEQEWGLQWVPVVATSEEDAWEQGCKLPGARPRDKQSREW